MKCNKKFVTVAVAGALTAATAVPALALENEFHGAFTSFYDLSNYSAAGNDGFEQFNTAGTGPGTQNATGLHKNAPTENYFEQRVRINYNAKASDQVKLVTKFELDYSFWGNSAYETGRNKGGALGADSVQIETKNLYLELNYPVVNAKIGMQPYADSFKGVLFDADMAGVLLSHDYSNAGVAAGFFRFSDRSASLATIGRNSYDMFSLDGRYNINKDIRVGAAYYYINDNRLNADAGPNKVKVHNLGVNAEAQVGPLLVNGFFLKQFGDVSNNELSDYSPRGWADTHSARGYAANLGVKMPLFGGTARSQFLYVSGGRDNFFQVGGEGGTEGGGFYDAEMIMLNRDKNALTIDTAIVYDANNYDQGVIMGTAGYDFPFSDKLSASANVGFAAVAHNNGVVAGTSDYLGTEVNGEVNYKLTANVTLGVRGGYVFLGDFFKNAAEGGSKPDNIYDMKILANYAF
jgi:hypothetical protein